MPRIVSVWLKSWPIARFLRAQEALVSLSEPVDPTRPFVLVAAEKGGPRLVALNAAAEKEGLAPGEPLADARAKLHDLQSRAADPATDTKALERLALWCLRYTPRVAVWGEAEGADGLFLDIAGCAHLFGGEQALLADLARRLRLFGLAPRLALADTVGAAWAIARHGRAEGMIVPAGGEANALRDLPLAALRLTPETSLTLYRLGFRRIGELLAQPRAPFVRRAGAGLLLRLDRALGRLPEPLRLLMPPPAYAAQSAFVTPIATAPQLLEVATRLLGVLLAELARDNAGIRRLRLVLFGVAGEATSLELELAAPNRDPAHIARLLALRLDRLSSELDAATGFDAMGLAVSVAEPMKVRQGTLIGANAAVESIGLARLIDTLEEKLGAGSVRRLLPRASHIPERAVLAQPAAATAAGVWDDAGAAYARPLLLLSRPQPAEVMALVPDGPPRQFRWQGRLLQVAQAEGPERIAPEWWRSERAEPERDYYLVEDGAGRRFWLYRAGHYGGANEPPSWFVHGFFP